MLLLDHSGGLTIIISPFKICMIAKGNEILEINRREIFKINYIDRDVPKQKMHKIIK